MLRLELSACNITTATKVRIEKNFLMCMDKELLEKILKGVITVQGDFVMEKHVEHEIGNVEAGGIGIQIVHGGTATSPDKPRAAKPASTDAVRVLDTPEAKTLWEKAQAAGWVDAERQPTSRLSEKVAKAMFANVIVDLLNIPSPVYEPFEALWGETDLGRSYASGNSYKKNSRLKDEIKETLR